MFNIGDYVLTVKDGICEITDITVRDFTGVEKEYYVLIPVNDDKAVSYIPTATAENLMRHLMDQAEATAVMDDIPNVEPIKVPSERFRQDVYRGAFKSRKPEDLVSLCKHLKARKNRFEERGKILSFNDEVTFSRAFELLVGELSYSLNREQNTMRVTLSQML